MLICRWHCYLWCKESIFECSQRPECKVPRTHSARIGYAVGVHQCWWYDGICMCGSCFTDGIHTVLWNGNWHHWQLRYTQLPVVMLVVPIVQVVEKISIFHLWYSKYHYLNMTFLMWSTLEVVCVAYSTIVVVCFLTYSHFMLLFDSLNLPMPTRSNPIQHVLTDAYTLCLHLNNVTYNLVEFQFQFSGY